MISNKFNFNHNDLTQKNLLTITESCFYLNVSRRLFDHLEKSDPTFPKRKTPRRHSRSLLDAWLSENGSLYFEKSPTQQLEKHACRFALSMDQIN
jgi:hypothetical protein